MSVETQGLLPIGRFALATGLTVKALRHYAEIRLLRPARVDEWTGYRYYSLAQIRTAAVIARLRALDVPLAAVAELLEADDATVRSAPFPKLVVSGAHHPAFDAICDVLETRLGAERAVVPAGGHNIPHLGALPFNGVLQSFVQRAEDNASGS